MYTLAIDDVVEVPVKFTLKAGKVNKAFAFTLIATRRTQEEIEAWISNKSKTVPDILVEVVTGWAGQRLVIDSSTGEPAEFNAESFAAMLNVGGVASTCYLAYLRECGAKEKN